MSDTIARTILPLWAAVHIFLLLLTFSPVQAQPANSRVPLSPQQQAPIDLTGYWVAIITEDWRWRMLTPPRGDYAGVPMTAAAIEAAAHWDINADIRDGNECRPYGAGGILRVPGRLRIQWQDGNTLRLDTDAGGQTRLFHFNEVEPDSDSSWQGNSVAAWELVAGAGGDALKGGNLKVVTSGMKSGYVRWNGVPYSEAAAVTDYFDRHSAFGQEWFTVTTIIEDPVYFTVPFIVSSHFRKEQDGSLWNPGPCVTAAPAVESIDHSANRD